MNVKELFNKISFDDMWEQLRKYNMSDDSQKEFYLKAFEEIKLLTPKINKEDKISTVITVLYEDDVSSDDDILEPRLDVSGINPDATDNETYAMEFSDWETWLGFTVWNKSIEVYGEAAVLASIIFEMTFFGYSYENANENINREIQVLNERHAEVEEDIKNDNLHSYTSVEELFAELGYVDSRTPEEKEADLDKSLKISIGNILVTSAIMGKNRVPEYMHTGEITDEVLSDIYNLLKQGKRVEDVLDYCSTLGITYIPTKERKEE